MEQIQPEESGGSDNGSMNSMWVRVRAEGVSLCGNVSETPSSSVGRSFMQATATGFVSQTYEFTRL